MKRLFDTQSHSWREAGLARQLSVRAVKRARIQAIVMVPLLIGILVGYGYRDQVFGRAYETPVQIATTVVLIVLGWQIARDVGRALGPTLFRRLDPGTAGRSASSSAWSSSGSRSSSRCGWPALTRGRWPSAARSPRSSSVSRRSRRSGNLIAGTVLLSARPFRVGERVRLQGGGIAGQIEGIVSSLGLLYTTFAQGEDHVMIPNSVVLNVAIVPLREPDGVDLRARLPADVTPLEVQELLDSSIRTPVRSQPQITLEELDGDEVVVRISATPERPSDGPRLASEVLEAVSTQTGRAA